MDTGKFPLEQTATLNKLRKCTAVDQRCLLPLLLSIGQTEGKISVAASDLII